MWKNFSTKKKIEMCFTNLFQPDLCMSVCGIMLSYSFRIWIILINWFACILKISLTCVGNYFCVLWMGFTILGPTIFGPLTEWRNNFVYIRLYHAYRTLFYPGVSHPQALYLQNQQISLLFPYSSESSTGEVSTRSSIFTLSNSLVK